MTKSLMRTLGVLVLFAAVGSVQAAETRGRQVRAILQSETGDQTEFNISEGQPLKFTNAEKGLEYRVVAEVTGKNQARFKVFDARTNALLDTLDLAADGKLKGGARVPFSLGVTGIKDVAKQSAPVGKVVDNGDGKLQQQEPGGGSCCVVCGGWMVCCTPAAGWCCDVSSSCGASCGVCN